LTSNIRYCTHCSYEIDTKFTQITSTTKFKDDNYLDKCWESINSNSFSITSLPSCSSLLRRRILWSSCNKFSEKSCSFELGTIESLSDKKRTDVHSFKNRDANFTGVRRDKTRASISMNFIAAVRSLKQGFKFRKNSIELYYYPSFFESSIVLMWTFILTKFSHICRTFSSINRDLASH